MRTSIRVVYTCRPLISRYDKKFIPRTHLCICINVRVPKNTCVYKKWKQRTKKNGGKKAREKHENWNISDALYFYLFSLAILHFSTLANIKFSLWKTREEIFRIFFSVCIGFTIFIISELFFFYLCFV